MLFRAAFAAAAARQLEKEEKPFNNRWYVLTLVFLACLFTRKMKYYAAHDNWLVVWILFWFILDKQLP